MAYSLPPLHFILDSMYGEHTIYDFTYQRKVIGIIDSLE